MKSPGAGVKQITQDTVSAVRDEAKNTVYEAQGQMSGQPIQSQAKEEPFVSDEYREQLTQQENERLEVLRKKLRSMIVQDEKAAHGNIQEQQKRVSELQQEQMQSAGNTGMQQEDREKPNEVFAPQSVKDRRGVKEVKGRKG